mgnify:CR=1 FL=1
MPAVTADTLTLPRIAAAAPSDTATPATNSATTAIHGAEMSPQRGSLRSRSAVMVATVRENG